MTDYYIYEVIGKRGTGKSTWATAFVKQCEHDNILVVSNLKLKNIKNFFYSPLGLFPSNYKDFKLILLFLDDIKSLRNAPGLLEFLASQSRKVHTTTILTLQYYAHAIREARHLSDYYIFPEINKRTDVLRFKVYEIITAIREGKGSDENVMETKIKLVCKKRINGISYYWRFFDTYERVQMASPRVITNELSRLCECVRDLDTNLEIISKNKTEKNTFYKEVLKIWQKRLSESDFKVRTEDLLTSCLSI